MSDRELPVQVENVSYYYQTDVSQRRVLHEVSLGIEPGEIIILTGPSGSGKTTLITLIGALRAAQSGSVKVLGHELLNAKESALEKVRKVLKIAREPISLETPIGEEEDSHLGDFIEDKKFMLPSEAAVSLNLAEQTRKVLATLTPREEKVLRMRFGIGEKADHTLEEVGQDFAVTRERIRQIEAQALRKLQHSKYRHSLKSFLTP